MGSVCSSRCADGTCSNSTTRIDTQGTDSDILRSYAQNLRMNRQKTEHLQESLREFTALVEDSEIKEDQEKFKEPISKIDIESKETMTRIESLNSDVGKLIDQTEKNPTKLLSDSVLVALKHKIEDLSLFLEELDKEFNDIRTQWRQSLVENDRSQQLSQDLSQLFKKIQNESSTYQNLLKQVQQQLEDLISVFKLILDDSNVKRDYLNKYEEIQRNKDRINQYQSQLKFIKERFYKSVERMKELLTIFSNSTKESGKISCQQLERIDDEAQKFLELNRKLGSDIQSLQFTLQERRTKLGDFDIKDNLTQKRNQFVTVFNQTAHLEETVNGLSNALEIKLIATIDEQKQSELEPIKDKIEFQGQLLQDKYDILNDINEQIKQLEEQLENEEQYDKMSISVITSIIVEIGTIGSTIIKLRQDLEDIENHLEIYKLQMGEEDVEHKIHSHSQQTLQLHDQISEIKSELNVMQQLTSNLYDYASDEEESSHILLMLHSISQLKDQAKKSESDCQNISLDIESLINESQEDEITKKEEIIQKVGMIERQINKQDKEVDEISQNLRQKQHAMLQFDLGAKCRRRQQEMQEGKKLCLNIISAQEIMMYQIEECEKDKTKKVNKISEQLRNQSDQLNDLSNKQLQLESHLQQQIQSQIPEDTFAISSQDQVRLLKELKTLRTQHQEILTKLQQLNQNTLQIEEKLASISVKADLNPRSSYNPQQDDEVDQLMSEFIENNVTGKEYDIQRIGPGEYQIGPKRVEARVYNGKLMVKVGGGMMTIEEFGWEVESRIQERKKRRTLSMRGSHIEENQQNQQND